MSSGTGSDMTRSKKHKASKCDEGFGTAAVAIIRCLWRFLDLQMKCHWPVIAMSERAHFTQNGSSAQSYVAGTL